MENEIEPLSRGELTERIKAIRKKIKIYGWLAISVLVIASVLAAYFNKQIGALSFVIIIVSFGFTIFFFSKWDDNKKALLMEIKRNFAGDIREMLAKIFELESYQPNDCFDAGHIKEAGLIRKFDTISGSDLVKGRYKGVPFAFCDLLLTGKILDNDSDDDTYTMFKGQWIEFNLKRPMNSVVYVAERKEKLNSGFQKNLKTAGLKVNRDLSAFNFGRKVEEAYTDSDEFNKNYQIFTDDPQAIFYILTPHFMEYILSADKAADSRTLFCFVGDRAIVAMENERDLFDLDDMKKDDMKKAMDFDWIHSKFQSDLQFITSVFDEMLRNEYLFGTEVN